MGSHIVLIMASGGEDGVWKHPKYPNKLLLPIAGVPLVVRTVKQIHAAGNKREPVVLTHWPEVQKVVPLYFVPERHFGYTETFMGAHEVWKDADRVTVLNGDVLWHPDVLKFVLDDRGVLRIYGDNLGHAGAWAFNKGAAATKVVAATRHNQATKHSPSQVHFFRRLCGCSQLRESKYFLKVKPAKTYTKDFDIAKDYNHDKIKRRL